MEIILASASPRRQELLQKVYSEFKIIPSNVNEILPEGILPEKSAEFLAKLKAQNIAKTHENSLIIGCDTLVLADGKILGKPKNSAAAKETLMLLSDRTHLVITGICLIFGNKNFTFSSTTEVTFFPLTSAEIDGYIATGEPFDKAGSYAIQGLGGLFVKEIFGDFYNVVGLPIARLKREIDNFLR
ncbi:MAG: Maf family protein [Oscillospiraceae bacterium]